MPPLTGLLDQINWAFGANRVSEVTGRSKRIILKDGKYQLSTRGANASIAETDAFQNGQKRILVFSASGSTGKSYHSDRSCLNQQPRRHYLAQCGWNVVTVTQGFGRCNRANQVHAPEIVLISTDVPGEKRFSATVASKLSALGAISKGDRATANNGLFDQDTNDITSQYAKTALIEFYTDLNRNRIQGMSIHDFQQQTGLRLISESRTLLTDLPPIHTFLNRVLALPIHSQNSVFAEFEQRVRHRIAEAKEAGTYDRGLETIWSEHGFEVAESRVLHTQGNAETICHTIDKLTKPKLLSAHVASNLTTHYYQCYRHRKKPILAIAKVVDTRTKRDGSIVNVLDVRYPVTGADFKFERTDVDDFTAWAVVSPDADFWQEWDKNVVAAPEFVRKRFYLISGLLLPVWDKLPAESPKVWRLQANDGRVLLGRSIDKSNIVSVLNKFGIDTTQLLDASTIFDLVWNHRQKQDCGKWQLQCSYFKGENRLEILAVYDRADLEWLRSIGCFTEILNSQIRVFMPIDRAVEIINLLLK